MQNSIIGKMASMAAPNFNQESHCTTSLGDILSTEVKRSNYINLNRRYTPKRFYSFFFTILLVDLYVI
jgi:hypothetical protein